MGDRASRIEDLAEAVAKKVVPGVQIVVLCSERAEDELLDRPWWAPWRKRSPTGRKILTIDLRYFSTGKILEFELREMLLRITKAVREEVAGYPRVLVYMEEA